MPDPTAAPARWLTPLELVLLGALWGASFLFMRIAAPVFGPLPLVEVRLVTGALVLLPFLVAARAAFDARTLPLIALVGVFNAAVPFALFAWAAERAPAGIGAITNSLSVPFAALVAFLFWRERIGPLRALALGVGFAGVVVLASGRTGGGDVTGAALAGTLAAFLYGLGSNVIRRRLHAYPPVALGGATLGFAALALLPFALARWPSTPVPGGAWGAAVALGVLCTGFASALYFRLLRRVGVARAVAVTYLIPVFGIGWAWALLGEPLTFSMAVATLLILGSVAVSQRA